MAEQLLDQVRDIVDGPIDFEGQKLCEQLSTNLLCAIGGIAFVVGYLLQDIRLALFICLGGAAVILLVAVPPWPFYNKHPVKWLPIGGGSNNNLQIPQTIVIDEKAIQ